MENRNRQLQYRQSMEPKKGLFCTCLLSITTPVSSLLAKEFDVRSVWHGQVSLAAVNQICENHEAINGCKNLKIH